MDMGSRGLRTRLSSSKMDHWMGCRKKRLSDDIFPTIQWHKEFEVEVEVMMMMMMTSPVNRSFTRTYSKKVFLGGLPPDIDEDQIQARFAVFGSVTVYWPGKGRSPYMFPRKGYAFLFFYLEESVHRLIEGCWQTHGRLYYPVSSSSMANKMVEIRPWKISETCTTVDPYFFKKEVFAAFIGGIPQRVTAEHLARIVTDLFGGVSYIELSVDKSSYPMGFGVVVFSNYSSYASAVRQKFVRVFFYTDLIRVVEFKPFQKHPNERCAK